MEKRLKCYVTDISTKQSDWMFSLRAGREQAVLFVKVVCCNTLAQCLPSLFFLFLYLLLFCCNFLTAFSLRTLLPGNRMQGAILSGSVETDGTRPRHLWSNAGTLQDAAAQRAAQAASDLPSMLLIMETRSVASCWLQTCRATEARLPTDLQK